MPPLPLSAHSFPLYPSLFLSLSPHLSLPLMSFRRESLPYNVLIIYFEGCSASPQNKQTSIAVWLIGTHISFQIRWGTTPNYICMGARAECSVVVYSNLRWY